MDLYGFEFDETSPSIQKKIYYCKLVSDTYRLSEHISYYSLYNKRESIQNVLNYVLEDRVSLYDPICRYVSTELQKQGIYWYDTERILDACDMICGHYLDSCMEIYEDCCKAVNDLEKQQTLRELRKASRSRISPIASNIPSLAAGILTAGSINFASGIFHSAVNIVGNLFSNINCANNLNAIYQSSYTRKRLLYGLKQDCIELPQVIAYILCRELGDTWQYPFPIINLEETQAICNQISQHIIPESQWSKLIVECIINRIPYHQALYTFADKLLGTDNGNLISVAKLFHVARYYEAKEKQLEDKASMRTYLEQTKIMPRKFFGNHLLEAKAFLLRSGVSDRIYSRLEDQISNDFNAMLKQLLDTRLFIVNGRETGEIFDRNTRRHLILFEFDFPSLIAKQRQIQMYCELCHVPRNSNEQIYAFVDTTSFASRDEGLVITNRGFYPSRFCGAVALGKSLLYQKIDSMICDSFNQLEVIYNGKNVNLKLPAIDLLNNFLIFTCMYFKFGQCS